jgi:hypothetical protein
VLGAKGAQLDLDLFNEGDLAVELVQRLEVLTPEPEPFFQGRIEPLGGGAALRGAERPPVAQVAEAVGGVDDRCGPAAGQRLGAQGTLALGVGLDRGVLAQRFDDLRDLGPEASLDLGQLDIGLLDRVVEVGGDENVGVEAALGEQLLDSDRVLDEGVAVLPAVLALVGPARKAEGSIELAGSRLMPVSGRCLIDRTSSRSPRTLALFAGALESDWCN